MRLKLSGYDINKVGYNNGYQIKSTQSYDNVIGSCNIERSKYNFKINLMNILGCEFNKKDKYNLKIVDVKAINENIELKFNSISVASNNWRSCAYSPSLNRWVCISNSGTNCFMYSDNNGNTWNPVAIANYAWVNVIWSSINNQFVAINSNYTDRIIYSSDAITWTYRNIPAYSYRRLCFSSLNRYCAITNEGQIITCDGNASNVWTLQKNNSNYAGLFIIWSEKRKLFVAVNQGPSSARIIYSSDGITWNFSNVLSGAYRSICYNSDMDVFLTIASGGTTALVSNDAITWTQITLTGLPTSGTFDNIQYLSDLKIYMVSSSLSNIYYSINGVDWLVFITNDSLYYGIASNGNGNVIISGLLGSTSNRILINDTNIQPNIIDYRSHVQNRTSNIILSGPRFMNNKYENIIANYTNYNPNEEYSIDVNIRYNLGTFGCIITGQDFINLFYSKKYPSYNCRFQFKNNYNQPILNFLHNKIFTITAFNYDVPFYVMLLLFEDPTVAAYYNDNLNLYYPITISILPLINQWFINNSLNYQTDDKNNLQITCYNNKQDPNINLNFELRDLQLNKLQPIINEGRSYPNLEFIIDIE